MFDRKESNFKTIQNISSFKKRENKVSNEKSKNFQTLTSTGNHTVLDRLKTIKDKIENNQRTINKDKNKYNYISIETSPKIKNFFGTEENFIETVLIILKEEINQLILIQVFYIIEKQ